MSFIETCIGSSHHFPARDSKRSVRVGVDAVTIIMTIISRGEAVITVLEGAHTVMEAGETGRKAAGAGGAPEHRTCVAS